MTAESISRDHVDIRMYLQIDAAPNDDAYRVTIHVSELEIVIEAIERDVGTAIEAAADRCAKGLREHGYPVTAGDVLASLETIDSADGDLRRSLS